MLILLSLVRSKYAKIHLQETPSVAHNFSEFLFTLVCGLFVQA